MSKKLYKETFDCLQISDETFRKVRNINMNTKIKKIYKLRYAMIMAVITILFTVSNGVTYAATGKTIVKHVENIVQIVNDNEQDIEITTEENCNIQYKWESNTAGGNVTIELPDDTEDGYNVNLIEKEDGVEIKANGQKNGEEVKFNSSIISE